MPRLLNAATARDIDRRLAIHRTELLRQAYRYVVRNTLYPARVRHQAQLVLNSFPANTRPTTVSPRCIETGRGRGIITKYGLCRYQFRLKALAGEIPGMRKASW